MQAFTDGLQLCEKYLQENEKEDKVEAAQPLLIGRPVVRTNSDYRIYIFFCLSFAFLLAGAEDLAVEIE